jgi:hypothetical protein
LINPDGYTRQAYYNALNGALAIEVYKEDAPVEEKGDYVVVSIEGRSDSSNNQGFAHEVVVILDIVTVFDSYIDPDKVESYDQQVQDILKPTVQAALDMSGAGFQLVHIQPGTPTYLKEQDSRKYYRKITRYINHIAQR